MTPGGWTQLELVVATAIAGLLLVLALPHYRSWIVTTQLRNAAEALAHGMAVARAEAIKRGHRVNLCKSPDLRQCAEIGSWEAGWLVFADADQNGRIDDEDAVLRREGPLPPRIRVEATRPLDAYVSYTGLGHARMHNGALQMGSLRICHPGEPAWKVILANSGRVRIERTREPCA